MANDLFIKIDSIKGESQVEGHKDEIDVLSWNWGVSRPGTQSFGGGGGGGTKPDFQDLTFIHYLDRSSPTLWKFCASGKHIDQVTLCARRAGGKSPLNYFTVTLNGVVVSAVSNGASGDIPVESVTLNFAKVKMEYLPQKADGGKGEGVDMVWDIKAGKEA